LAETVYELRSPHPHPPDILGRKRKEKRKRKKINRKIIITIEKLKRNGKERER